MTKSSMVRRGFPSLILIVLPGALAAQPRSPEEAIERQRAEVSEVVNQVCPPGADPQDPNNVVVCGRREPFPRYRVPSADPALDMAPAGRAGGEQMAVLTAGDCLRLCHQPVMIDVIAAVRTISRGVDRLLHPD